MTRAHDIVVGLDVGTTKVSAIVGEMVGDAVGVIGVGTSRSSGLRKGVVINIEETVRSIRQAVEEAERMAGVQVRSVFTGISGGHIRGFNSHGIVAVSDDEITQEDVSRVIDAARAVAIPLDREVLHILPQEYVIDDQDGIREPTGMHGVRLEAKVHIVTAAASSARNVIRCANHAGLEVDAIVLQQLASAEATLTQDEKDLGVCLIDIGGGTADIALFSDGAIVHTSVLPLGGNHVTNDIALGMRTPQQEAEQLKRRHGCALVENVDPQDLIEVPSVGGREPRPLSRQILCEIIEARVEEIFQLVKTEIRQTGYEDLLASGVVLTGGTSMLDSIADVAEEVLGLPIRCGAPSGVTGMVDEVNSPEFATGVGLVRYGSRNSGRRTPRMGESGILSRASHKVRHWLGGIF
ncbi:MAG: cell division protein FtsA [Myxococcales bacterium]|nr:cell division protein FtsA [Myxococcales bacterium]